MNEENREISNNLTGESSSDRIFSDEYFMRSALRLAQRAAMEGEVPIGAVIVKDEMVISKGWNQVEMLKDATAHAEILAITGAAAALGDWRLEDCTLYVTKEPCAMCAGALVNSRIKRIVYGLSDPRSGCCGGALDITGFSGMLHNPEVMGGVLEEESKAIMQEFFREVRKRDKKNF